MSCTILSDDEINTIVSAINRDSLHRTIHLPDGTSLRTDDTSDLQRIADILRRDNTLAYATRYREPITAAPIKVKLTGGNITPVALLRLLDHFDYQASDMNNYDTSEARHIIDIVRRRTIPRLTGYANSTWPFAARAIATCP